MRDRQVEELVADVRDKDEQITTIRREMANKDGQIATMDERLAAMEGELATKDDHLAVMKEELSAMEEKLAAMEAKLSSSTQQLEVCRDRIFVLGGKLARFVFLGGGEWWYIVLWNQQLGVEFISLRWKSDLSSHTIWYTFPPNHTLTHQRCSFHTLLLMDH